MQHAATCCNTLRHTHTTYVPVEDREDGCGESGDEMAQRFIPSEQLQHPKHSIYIVAVCCSVLQCVAVCCSVNVVQTSTREVTLQNIAKYCNALQHTVTHCNTLHHTATHLNNTFIDEMTLQYTATYCNILQHIAAHCNALQHIPWTQRDESSQSHGLRYTHCNALQRTATHCNTLQHTTTHLTNFICNIPLEQLQHPKHYIYIYTSM